MNFCSQGALGHPTSAVRNKIICNPKCPLKVFKGTRVVAADGIPGALTLLNFAV